MDLKELYRDVTAITTSGHGTSVRLCRGRRERRRSQPAVAIASPSICSSTATAYAALLDGKGCAISVASASLMTEAVKGRDRESVARLFGDVHATLTGELAEPPASLGKLAALAGVREFPRTVMREPALAYAQRRARA